MKKIITLLSLCLVISFAAKSQYYYYPHINAGQNPGNLNNDGEYPYHHGLDASWDSIQGGVNSVAAWSLVQTIPFNFVFNGNTFTKYRVSTSGVLSFDTAFAIAPRYSPHSLIPSSRIPDNSILMWGLVVTGTNYNTIVTKTFGSAPNRQHWVVFNARASTGCYEFWGMVLEETTNKIYFVDMRNSKCTAINLTIGLQYNINSALQVFGSPSVTHKAGSSATSSDNSYYEFTPGSLPAVNAELSSVSNPSFGYQPTNIFLRGVITNYGNTPITDVTIKYKSGSTVYTDTKTGLNIQSYQPYNFTHLTALHIGSAVAYPLQVWIEVAGDVNQNDDSLHSHTSGMLFKPLKNIVFEEGTGTWCGWCPRGTVMMDWMRINHPDRAMLVTVHNADQMSFPEYDNGFTDLIAGFPSGFVSRKIIDVDPTTFPGYYDEQINDTVPCTVSVSTSFNQTSRLLTVDVSAHFMAALVGDFRFNAAVTEDGVTGTGDGSNATNNLDYDQENYYSGSTNILVGAGHNWNTETNPVPATRMIYDNVARAILGGFRGLVGSMPNYIPIDTILTHQFTYSVPARYQYDKMHVIGWVSNGATMEIYNANRVTNILGIHQEVSNAHHLLIYPNPSTGLVQVKSTEQGKLNMKVTVLNSLGETVVAYDKLDFSNVQLIDLSKQSNGLYFIQFIDENNSMSMSKIMINR